MKVAQALSEGKAALPRRRGLPDPHREALFLLAAAWGIDEVRLRIRPEETLPDDVEIQFRQWIKRRAAGEPAEYILGRCSFWGRSFRVTPMVLIPRPESELIIRAVLEYPFPTTCRALDIGTGSGCLAVTLAAERPGWSILGADLSPGALEVARSNATSHDVEVTWAVSDLGDACAPFFNLIVANLPYVPTGWLVDLGPEIASEPRGALDGGVDGLDLIRRLIDDLPRMLAPGGICLLELAEGQAGTVKNLGHHAGLQLIDRLRDVGGCDRAVILSKR